MKIFHHIVGNPALCSLVVALIGSITAIVVAILGWLWSLRAVKLTQKAESDRLIGFHKLEIYENAIEEINYLEPLYRQLWADAFDKRAPEEVRPSLARLRTTIETIVEYQKHHHALEKVQIYSDALKDYVPFHANPACLDYVRQLDSVEDKGQDWWLFSSGNKNNRVMEIYLLDELFKYEQCDERLKNEIEDLELFKK